MRFDKVIKMYGFVRNGEEPCVYKWTNDFVVIFLVLYIDDILLIENDIPTLQSVKLWLLSQFSMKNLEEASYILEIRSIEIDLEGCLDCPHPYTSIPY